MANDTVPYKGPDGRMWLNIDTSKSLVAADSGIVHNVIADAIVLTLPTSAAATVGATFIARNGGVPAVTGMPGSGSNGTVLVKLSPVAADGISGAAFSAAVNKAAQNTKATSVVGDEFQVVGTGLTTAAAWFCQGFKGTWAREA